MSGNNPYRALFENAREGFIHCRVIRNEQGRIQNLLCIDSNDAFDQLAGMSDPKGQTFNEHAPEVALLSAELFQVTARVLERGGTEELRFELGKDRPFQLKLVALNGDEFVAIIQPEPQTAAMNSLNSKGAAVRMLGVNQAITAQKEAEIALKKAYSEIESKVEQRTAELSQERRKLEIALEAGEMGIWTMDMTSRKATSSLRHALIFGYQAPIPDWSFDRFLSQVVDEDRNFVRRTNHDAFANSQPWHFECRIRRIDGEIRWIEVHGAPAAGDSILRHYIGTVEDITERKRIETALRQSEARLKKAEALAHMGHWEIDVETGEITWSDETYRIFGFDRQLKPAFNLVFKSVLPEYQAELTEQRAAAIAGKCPMDITYAFRRSDGAIRMNRACGVLTGGADGTPLRLIGTVQDVTEQEFLKKEAADARDAAERANAAKDLFLATLSHELRSPLTAILTWTQLMERGKVPPDKIRTALSTIRESAIAQNQLVSDLLDVSRIISGKLQIEKERIPLSGTLRSAIETLRPLAEAKSIRIDESLGDAPGDLWIHADPVRLKQVIWNLLSNAIKFTPSGGSIRVSARGVFDSGGDRAEILVEDSGKGIEPAFIPQLFTRFTQADSSSIRAHGGLGLGLSIVYSLIQLHGGSIRAESGGLGKGSGFTITLPLEGHSASFSLNPAPLRNEKMQQEVPEFSTRPLSSLKILIVEDDERTRTALGTSLASLGASVLLARSAVEGLNSCREFKPDVLVSDIAMPREDGYTLIRKLRELETKGKLKPVPAVALTAYADPETREKALAAGFQLHLPKPVDGEALAEAILRLQQAS